MNEDILLVSVLRQFYSINLVAWQPLPSDNNNRIYQLNLANDQRWVLRIFSSDDQSVTSLAQILLFLAQQGYPAEQVVTAVNNDAVVKNEGLQFLVTRFVEGFPVNYLPSALHLLGKTLGRLHALSVVDTTALPMAEMLPTLELAYAWSQLTNVADTVPNILQPDYDRLANAIYTLNRCENAPLVVIHNDCHPSNAIRTSSKEVLLIDWLGAGLGPAVIDVGFLLVSCEIPFGGMPLLSISKERISAIIDGYCKYHTLTPMELDLLPDAIRFRALVYGAVNFANAISKHEAERYDTQWWWIRYISADEITARARICFKKYT